MRAGGSTGDEIYTHDVKEGRMVPAGEMTLTFDGLDWSLCAETGGQFFVSCRGAHHRFSNSADDAQRIVLLGEFA